MPSLFYLLNDNNSYTFHLHSRTLSNGHILKYSFYVSSWLTFILMSRPCQLRMIPPWYLNNLNSLQYQNLNDYRARHLMNGNRLLKSLQIAPVSKFSLNLQLGYLRIYSRKTLSYKV